MFIHFSREGLAQPVAVIGLARKTIDKVKIKEKNMNLKKDFFIYKTTLVILVLRRLLN
jgi:hypothetical protein